SRRPTTMRCSIPTCRVRVAVRLALEGVWRLGQIPHPHPPLHRTATDGPLERRPGLRRTLRYEDARLNRRSLCPHRTYRAARGLRDWRCSPLPLALPSLIASTAAEAKASKAAVHYRDYPKGMQMCHMPSTTSRAAADAAGWDACAWAAVP